MLYNLLMKLSSPLLTRLQALTDDIITYETSRIANLKRLEELLPLCVLDEKYRDIHTLLDFKAMNLMGISLSEEALGEIQEARYIQLLVIAPKQVTDKKSTNISLGYFGKAETVLSAQIAHLTEFVLRWRYEKSFLNLNHYKKLLDFRDHKYE